MIGMTWGIFFGKYYQVTLMEKNTASQLVKYSGQNN